MCKLINIKKNIFVMFVQCLTRRSEIYIYIISQNVQINKLACILSLILSLNKDNFNTLIFLSPLL